MRGYIISELNYLVDVAVDNREELGEKGYEFAKISQWKGLRRDGRRFYVFSGIYMNECNKNNKNIKHVRIRLNLQ